MIIEVSLYYNFLEVIKVIKTNLKTKVIEPSILYYGTPVILLNTLNEDGTTNITPMSSSWALGDRIVLGLGLGGKAVENLRRHHECVINIPDEHLWQHVEKLAPYTGKKGMPDWKRDIGFRYEKDKYQVAGLTPIASTMVQPTRIAECPLQIEAIVKNMNESTGTVEFVIIEAQKVCVHAHEEIVINERHVNTDRWHPLIYNFRHYFGRGKELGKTFRAET
jgi:flavin reductase (DIM6/NTAB) family NADH-FMN oxidoreductase RutF